MVKIQIKSWSGKLLFEYEEEVNTVKKILQNAVLSGADLSGADLSGADLSGAVLSGADLRNADLRNAVLSGADLSGAVLSGADLSGADLSGADLPIFCKWNISIYNDKIKIGCKTKFIEDWDLWFFGTETFNTNRDSEDFKRIYANYVAVREYYKILNK